MKTAYLRGRSRKHRRENNNRLHHDRGHIDTARGHLREERNGRSGRGGGARSRYSAKVKTTTCGTDGAKRCAIARTIAAWQSRGFSAHFIARKREISQVVRLFEG